MSHKGKNNKKPSDFIKSRINEGELPYLFSDRAQSITKKKKLLHVFLFFNNIDIEVSIFSLKKVGNSMQFKGTTNQNIEVYGFLNKDATGRIFGLTQQARKYYGLRSQSKSFKKTFRHHNPVLGIA